MRRAVPRKAVLEAGAKAIRQEKNRIWTKKEEPLLADNKITYVTDPKGSTTKR